MAAILITGIHGFVGSNLVAGLKGNHDIYGLTTTSKPMEGMLQSYSWDDLDTTALPSFDAIIHLAGKAHETKRQSSAAVYFKINTGLTKKIFDYFSTHPNIKKFIFLSSCAVVSKVPGSILTEDVAPCPKVPYGESKMRAEAYILDRMASDPAAYQGREIIILRPGMIHGPGNKGNLNLLYGFVKKGLPWPLGAFENRRTFTSIDNLSFVIKGLLTASVESGIYNMADDEALSTNELIAAMCDAMGEKARIWRIGKKFIRLGARIGDLLHLPLNSFRLDKLTEDYVVSNAKIKKALDIDRMPVRAADGLKSTILSFNTPSAK